MKPIRKFEEFIKENVVKKQSKDKSRAEFLIKESENSYNVLLEMLEQLKISDNNANLFVKSCYDILTELIRAKMLLEGYMLLVCLEGYMLLVWERMKLKCLI